MFFAKFDILQWSLCPLGVTRAVPGILGVFLSVFECFGVFWSVFEPKTPILSYFEGISKGGLGQKTPIFAQFLAQKQHGPKSF